MNVVIFDTETTSLDKPFCYNIGYVIANEQGQVLLSRDYVVEQIWHNLPLFSSAYYADKRALYVLRMRSRTTLLEKFGYICQQMIRDFKQFSVERAFAYNSPFDDRVFAFNCDWFKCKNPFDDMPIVDIRGFAHAFIVDDKYKAYCEEHKELNESGNYSTSAQSVYRYLFLDDFEEEHTALADSQIEKDILFACVVRGANLQSSYATQRSIVRSIERELHIRTPEQVDYYFKYNTIRINKERTEITLK